MSNQISLMLSFIFLSFFIVLSGEIVAYQQISAKTLAVTNEIAIYIEENGYDYNEVSNLPCTQYLSSFNVFYTRDLKNGYIIYDITTKKKYTAFSSLYQFMSQDIICKMTVCRKE